MVYILSENNVGLDEFLPALMNHSRNLQRKSCIMNILQLKNILILKMYRGRYVLSRFIEYSRNFQKQVIGW